MNAEKGINPELNLDFLWDGKNVEILSGLFALAFGLWIVRSFRRIRTQERLAARERAEMAGRSSLLEARKGDLKRRMLLKRTFQGEGLRLVPQVEPLLQSLDMLVLSVRSLYGWISLPRPVLLASTSIKARKASIGAPQALRRLEQTIAESYEYCLNCIEMETGLEADYELSVQKITEVQLELEALERKMEAGHDSHRPMPLEEAMNAIQKQTKNLEHFFAKRPKIRR